MPRLKQPKTFLVGYTVVNQEGLYAYLEETGNEVFKQDFEEAIRAGISGGEALCSFFAKLCYKALCADSGNMNISRTRSIEDNLKRTLDQAHGSVFEHCSLNFVTTDCSRVFTHELVRHRVGTAFSQTSGRFVRGEVIDFVHDPILDLAQTEIEHILEAIENGYNSICDAIGINGEKAAAQCRARQTLTDEQKTQLGMNEDGTMPMDRKKKLTSALRRLLPNGQANEIGWTANLRSIRHLIMMRTSRHAEWEIRKVFSQVYKIMLENFPLMVSDAVVSTVEGALEVTGMKMQPYEREV